MKALLLHWQHVMQPEMAMIAILQERVWCQKGPVQVAVKCTTPDFLKCQPLNFKGTEGVVGLTQWFEKMESVYSISNCTVACQVKFATCTLQGNALTWWNSHVKTTTPEAAHAMPWRTLKKMMTDKYCPRGEIKKLEFEMMTTKEKADDTAGTTKSATKTRDKPGRAYAEGNGDRKPYGVPYLNLCRDCRSPPNVNTRANQRACFECGAQGHFKKDCPKLKNNNNWGNQAGNAKAQAKVYAVGNAGANPDNNVVTGNNHRNQKTETSQGEKERLKITLCCCQEFPEVFPEDLPGIPPTRTSGVSNRIGTRRRKMGLFRMCIDLQGIEQNPDREEPLPTPRIDDYSTSCKGSMYLFKNRYESKVSPVESSRRRTFLRLHSGLDMVTMNSQVDALLALTNAPRRVHDLMKLGVSKPYLDKFVIVFIDDFLISPKVIREHENTLGRS
ncbi:putative reverse transcriptase domain-containing protein [Tanacetum coccineum]